MLCVCVCGHTQIDRYVGRQIDIHTHYIYNVYIYVYTHTHTNTHIHTSICMYVCMYVCIRYVLEASRPVVVPIGLVTKCECLLYSRPSLLALLQSSSNSSSRRIVDAHCAHQSNIESIRLCCADAYTSLTPVRGHTQSVCVCGVEQVKAPCDWCKGSCLFVCLFAAV